MVTVAQATDAATAQADWSQEQAQAQNAMTRSVPPGVTVNFNTNDLSNVQGADRAALAQASMNLAGRPINAVAIYLLKGANFVTFSNLQVGQPGPTPEAMQSEAQTVVGRIP